MTERSVESPIREIILRSWTDPSFRERLIKDPKSVFEEFGLGLPKDGRELLVVENGPTQVYFVLPETPDLGSLSNDEIRSLVDSALGVQLVLPTILAR